MGEGTDVVLVADAGAGEVGPGGFDDLGNEVGHGEFDVKLDKVCERVEDDVSGGLLVDGVECD